MEIRNFIDQLLTSENSRQISEQRAKNYGIIDAQISKHFSGERIRADVAGYEANATDTNLAPWVQPLHLEKNLNTAIDTLDSLEALRLEYHSIILTKIQQNYISSTLKTEKHHEAYEKHVNLSKSLPLNEYTENLILRISKTSIDLFEYTKATKIGVNIIFDKPVEYFEYSNDYPGLTRIRESLRAILEFYRLINKNKQESIIPISMKGSQDIHGNFLSNKWSDNASKRNESLGLEQEEIEIDLKNFEPINHLNFNRIRRVGVQVIDRLSLVSKRAPGSDNDSSVNYWKIQMKDMDGGIKLSSSGSIENYLIDTVRFDNVAGTDVPQNITWSNYEKLLNMNANRKWKIMINDNSHKGNSKSSIRDIVLHFHLAYQEQ